MGRAARTGIFGLAALAVFVPAAVLVARARSEGLTPPAMLELARQLAWFQLGTAVAVVVAAALAIRAAAQGDALGLWLPAAAVLRLAAAGALAALVGQPHLQAWQVAFALAAPDIAFWALALTLAARRLDLAGRATLARGALDTRTLFVTYRLVMLALVLGLADRELVAGVHRALALFFGLVIAGLLTASVVLRPRESA